MIDNLLKFRKIIIYLIIISLFVYFYNNGPYSNYEINRISEINYKLDTKDYYLNKVQHTANSEKKKIKQEFVVRKNNTLSSILNKAKVKTPSILLKKGKKNCFYIIQIKDVISITKVNGELLYISKKNKNIECIYNAKDSSLKIINNKKIDGTNIDFMELVFFNKISNSFYNSALSSGLTPNEIMSIADIFGWDVDFTQDIRKNDSFGIVVKRIYEGKKHIKSIVKYALFKNKKKVHEAYNFKEVYYDSRGYPLRKQFLRAPIDFYRISSHFNRKRLHPIFKTVRPHLGTDYAAPKGTPIYSTGDGTIIFKGRKGGYGKTIIIKHGNIYTTLYAHMSKYKKGMHVGKKVKQKQIIGYVGSTGYSTGPHLHYEFRVRGKHKDVMKVKFKKGKKLNSKSIIKMKENHKLNETIYLWLRNNYSI